MQLIGRWLPHGKARERGMPYMYMILHCYLATVGPSVLIVRRSTELAEVAQAVIDTVLKVGTGAYCIPVVL